MKHKRLRTIAPAVGQVWRYRDDVIRSAGPCYRIESVSEHGVIGTPGLWTGSYLEPLPNHETKAIPMFDLGRTYEYIGDEAGALPMPNMEMPLPARFSFEPMLDRLTVAAERIADALEKMARPTLHEAVEAAAAKAAMPTNTRCVGHVSHDSQDPGWRCNRFGTDTILRDDGQWWCDDCDARRRSHNQT